MWPFLFHAGGVPVYTYGVLHLLAIVAVAALGARGLRSRGAGPEVALDAALAYPIAMFAFARVPFVFLEYGFTSRAIRELPNIAQGGLWGGLVFWIGGLGLYALVRRFPFWTTLDLLAPWVLLALGLGKLGCFFSGCCWGGPSGAFPGLLLSPECRYAYPKLPLHPVPLYDALWAFLAFALLLVLARRPRRPGFAFLAGIGLYSLERFASEFLRFDYCGKTALPGLHASQLVEIATLALAGGLLIAGYVRRAAPGGSAPAAARVRDVPFPPGAVPGSVRRRALAFLVDSAPAAFLVALAAAAGNSAPLFGLAGAAFLLLHAAAAPTPGQRLLGLRLLDASGRPASLPRRALRAFLLPLSVASLLGVVRAAVSTGGQGFHDMAAGVYAAAAERLAVPVQNPVRHGEGGMAQFGAGGGRVA